MPDARLDLSPWTRPRAAGAPAAIAVGTMNFGKRTPAAEAQKMVARAIESGHRFFDTANAYTDGESERILGKAVKKHRAEVGIATKVGFGRNAGKPEGLSKARVLAAFDESRERLGTDYVDVYYLHVPDHATPIEETLEAVAELFQRGAIRAFGVSNYASWQMLEIDLACDAMGIARPVLSQQMYNLLIRQLDVEYFRFARKHPVHTTVYNALAGGLLSGRHVADAPIPGGSRFDKNKLYQGRYWTQRMFDAVDTYREVAAGLGMTLVELSYAWLGSRPGVDSVLVGPATVEQLDAATGAVAKGVSEEALRRIDEIHRGFMGTDANYAR
jgi:aryl-alcohol dehydrogenase-like predicted oxidoreductase